MFNRLIYLNPSGFILDSSKLDLLFTLPTESAILGISGNPQEEDTAPSIILLDPSAKAYNETMALTPSEKRSDKEFFQHIPLMAGRADRTQLVAKTSAIHLESDYFNATKFMETTSYVHISDPGVPGPEFDIPRPQFMRAKPKQLRHRKTWEAVYERFREQRMNICGLDLEPFPAVALEADNAGDSNEADGKNHDTQRILSEPAILK